MDKIKQRDGRNVIAFLLNLLIQINIAFLEKQMQCLQAAAMNHLLDRRQSKGIGAFDHGSGSSVGRLLPSEYPAFGKSRNGRESWRGPGHARAQRHGPYDSYKHILLIALSQHAGM